MTPTWPSIAAGTDGARAARTRRLVAWLRCAAAEPALSSWVLRGSIVTAALCPGAREPGDVDYLAPGDGASFDAGAIEAAVRAACARREANAGFEVERVEVIWPESPAPGLRAFIAGDVDGAPVEPFQIDIAVGDPMCVPPRVLAIAGVGDVLAVAPETLFGWKLHGLAELGRGKWRAKDLYDLDLLWRHDALDPDATRAAIALAFSSRDLALAALDDFRTRATWGQSLGGNRKWRVLRKAHPQITDDQTTTRDRLRAALDALLGVAV
jgi:hypothetical protein